MKYLPMLIGRLSLLPRTQDMFHGRQSTLKKKLPASSACYPSCNQGEADKKQRRDTLTAIGLSTHASVPHYCMLFPDGRLLRKKIIKKKISKCQVCKELFHRSINCI